MALITCPECGQQVSDKASVCVHCGSPIAHKNKVAIKLLFFSNTSLIGRPVACEVEITGNGQLLWRGLAGTIARFEVEEPTQIKMVVKHAYTGHPFPFYSDFAIACTVEPGKKYQLSQLEIALFGDPTKSKYRLSEVDIIDSD